MSSADTYRTLAGVSTGEFRDRGSKFIAYAFPIETDADWQAGLEGYRKLHPKARHHCYAYRIGLDGNHWRANDDGEPANTAGRPILGQIDSFGLTNVCVVVVRYFGGTLLGASGLIQAYKTSAMEALAAAETVEKIVCDAFRLSFDYALMSPVMNALSQLELPILAQNFDEGASVEIAIRHSETQPTLRRLKALAGKRYLEEIADETTIPGLEITWLRRS
jgi:uncharacterized YigZ family protein